MRACPCYANSHHGCDRECDKTRISRKGRRRPGAAGVCNEDYIDKTGTLTYGTPRVTAVKSLSKEWTDEELFRLTACAEQRSEHPLGKAIVESYKINILTSCRHWPGFR